MGDNGGISPVADIVPSTDHVRARNGFHGSRQLHVSAAKWLGDAFRFTGSIRSSQITESARSRRSIELAAPVPVAGGSTLGLGGRSNFAVWRIEERSQLPCCCGRQYQCRILPTGRASGR